MYAYVVALWLGERRAAVDGYHTDKFHYLSRHLKFLKDNKIDGLDVALIVLSTDKSAEVEETKKFIVDNAPYACTVELMVRPNVDGSYGAWHDAVIELIKNYTVNVPNQGTRYALLLEDDYLPDDKNVMEDIVKYMTPKIGYVCQYWDDVEEFHCGGPIAAIANGMLDLSKAKEILDEKQVIFNLSGERVNLYLPWNQLLFLSFLRSKYQVYGLNHDYFHPFWTGNGIIKYGTGKRSVISPICR